LYLYKGWRGTDTTKLIYIFIPFPIPLKKILWFYFFSHHTTGISSGGIHPYLGRLDEDIVPPDFAKSMLSVK